MNDFDKTGYILIKNFLDESSTRLIALYLRNKISSGEWMPGIVGGTEGTERTKHNNYEFFSEPLIETILEVSTPKVSEFINKELYPTYSFLRFYDFEEDMPRHVDRPSCEYSLTINISYEGDPNLLWTEDLEGKVKGHNLEPGDALLYKGCEVFHWREPLQKNQKILQFMLHYVDKNGEFSDYKYDLRPYLSCSTLTRLSKQ